jgi:aryl-alcohol dehydrogenase-like predicted oxidoreductase
MLKNIYLGMALAPWNVLAGGKIRTDEEEEKRRQTGENGRALFTDNWERNDKEKTVCKALEKVAAEIGAKHITSGNCFLKPKHSLTLANVSSLNHQVAIAYLMQKTPYVFPIVGGRKVEHLMANIEALEITLSDDQIEYLESVVPFEHGFPHWIIVSNLFYPHGGHFTTHNLRLSRAMDKTILACSALVRRSLKAPYSNLFVLEKMMKTWWIKPLRIQRKRTQ